MNAQTFQPTDEPVPGAREAIFKALDDYNRGAIGPSMPRLLVIPIHGDDGAITGGLWGRTMLDWLCIDALVVPEPQRGCGIGSAVMARAEQEARARGCLGMLVEACGYQATRFCQKHGFAPFAAVEDFPPGRRIVRFRKHLVDAQAWLAQRRG